VRASRAARLVVVAGLLAAGFSGCATYDMQTDVAETARTMRAGPVSAPERNITNFSDALRCMDGLFITYGIRDVAVMVEDLDDKTKKVTAGTKDMLISATSSMTRRSSAIRLNTFGKDSIGLTEWILRGGRSSTFNDLPQFVIRGSVSQFDQNLSSGERSGGIAIGNVVSAGAADRVSRSRLAIDLNMIHGSNFSIVPGVTSQNSIEIRNEGKGVDADATIRKLGINFNMTIAKSEGQAQGLRNLVDLAVIELFGRLSRTPYWVCIGSSADSPEVAKEIEDWHYAMERNENLVPYVQYQMRIRGYYAGPIDGQMSQALGESVALYRAAMGGERGRAVIDADFFKRYLTADHAQVLVKNPPPVPAPGANTDRVRSTPSPGPSSAPSGPSAPAVGRLQISVQSASGEQIFDRGQPIQLAVAANRPAHLHCYMRDERQQLQRIFPNRFNRDTLVRAGETLQLPGSMRFQIVASPRGSTEAVVCYATERDVLAELPRRVLGVDFENLALGSFDEIKAAFRSVSNDQFAEGVFHVRTR
jgi:curli biogenesis system outer membrane secretion channel CsgG